MALVLQNYVNTPEMAITHVYIPPGASDYTNTIIQQASALSGGGALDRILSVQGCLVGFTAAINFDQTTPAVAEVLPNGYPFTFNTNVNFPHLVPLDNPNGTGTTGNITITTTGLTTTGYGWLIISTWKKAPSPLSGQ